MKQGASRRVGDFNRVMFFWNRLRERLWVKPLSFCVLSILMAFLAGLADYVDHQYKVPDISSESIETLLTIISSSMLVIAMFAAGAMLSAYSSASNIATPRSFSLVVADDVSQNALSTFIGAFIFSIVGLVALLNGFYSQAGRFVLFILIIIVFSIVILSFVRWVDRIARLGRMGTAIEKVEAATASAMKIRAHHPSMGAAAAHGPPVGDAVFAESVGYVERIDVARLHRVAEDEGVRIRVAALPGTFVCAGQPLIYVHSDAEDGSIEGEERMRAAFEIGKTRTFDEDPRFGLVVLSEISSRALSPGINDPGTAIEVIGSYVRLFTLWANACPENAEYDVEYDRVEVPELILPDMFDDAFRALARDGAGVLEVMIRLQKALHSLASLEHNAMSRASAALAMSAMKYAERKLILPEEIDALRAVAEGNLGMVRHRQ